MGLILLYLFIEMYYQLLTLVSYTGKLDYNRYKTKFSKENSYTYLENSIFYWWPRILIQFGHAAARRGMLMLLDRVCRKNMLLINYVGMIYKLILPVHQ